MVMTVVISVIIVVVEVEVRKTGGSGIVNEVDIHGDGAIHDHRS